MIDQISASQPQDGENQFRDQDSFDLGLTASESHRLRGFGDRRRQETCDQAENGHDHENLEVNGHRFTGNLGRLTIQDKSHGF